MLNLSDDEALETSVIPGGGERSLHAREEGEGAKHARAVERLAEEMEKAVEEIRPIYETILASLLAVAAIPDYLPIIVSRRVRRHFADG